MTSVDLIVEKKYRYLIWDWNGTLLNDLELCLDLTNKELQNYGLEAISRDTYRAKVKHPISEFYKSLGFSLDQNDFLAVADRFLEQYHLRIGECSLQVGALKILEQQRARRVKQSILSAHYHLSLIDCLKFFDLTDYFEFTYGLQEKTAASKLDLGRELLDKILETNSELALEDIVLIGDTDHDALVAKELSIDCILVSHGYQSVERLLDLGHKIVGDFNKSELFCLS